MNPADGAMISNQLYIPIWLYSNAFMSASVGTYSRFTFQSGYIQMVEETGSGANTLNFTFQSGYIQIKSNKG